MQSRAPAQTALNVSAASSSSSTTVTVRPGDTLSKIAQGIYGRASAWYSVAECNGFLSERNRGDVSPLHGGDLLYVGDEIVLPAADGRCPG